MSPSGSEIALSAEEIEARFKGSRTSLAGAPPPAPDDYYRAEALSAWQRLRFDDVLANLGVLRAKNGLYWTDWMRMLGAYAITGRWSDVLGELRVHREQWAAAPELIYMESVALTRSHDDAAVARHCRAALDATRGTRHPERAYWAARACLLSTAVTEADRPDVEARIAVAYERFAGNLARSELQAVLLLRTGRAMDAYQALQSSIAPTSTIRPALLLVAAAAARAGRAADARAWLARADALPKPIGYTVTRLWLEVEADGLREEVLRGIR